MTHRPNAPHTRSATTDRPAEHPAPDQPSGRPPRWLRLLTTAILLATPITAAYLVHPAASHPSTTADGHTIRTNVRPVAYTTALQSSRCAGAGEPIPDDPGGLATTVGAGGIHIALTLADPDPDPESTCNAADSSDSDRHGRTHQRGRCTCTGGAPGITLYPNRTGYPGPNPGTLVYPPATGYPSPYPGVQSQPPSYYPESRDGGGIPGAQCWYMPPRGNPQMPNGGIACTRRAPAGPGSTLDPSAGYPGLRLVPNPDGTWTLARPDSANDR